MSRFAAWAAAGLLLCLLLAGCQAGPGPAAARTAAPTVEDAPGVDVLDGTQWILVHMQGQAPLAGTQVTLNFDDGNLGGNTGCNDYGSPYTLQGGRLKADAIAQTVMLCESPAGVMEQEDRYVKVLSDATLQVAAPFRIIDTPEGRRLEITDNLGLSLLVYAEKQRFAMNPADLYKKAWRLVSLDGQPPSGEPPAEEPVLLYFLNESEYSGFAGCRHYYGAYQAEGDTIRFSSTFMLGPDCHENEPLNLQESNYTDYLGRARNYHLDGDRLDLLTEQGQVLSFLAQPMPLIDPKDTSWQLLAFFSPSPNAHVPHRIPTEPLLETELTLTFEAGRASGSAGCNTYTGAYSNDGMHIGIDLEAPAATRKLCALPEGIMQQEQLYLRLLEKSIIYRMLGDQFWLIIGDGQSLLFRRKP